MEPIPVCYCGNKKVFSGLLLSALSLAKTTDDPLHLYILSMDLHAQNPAFIPYSENQMQILNEALQAKNPESRAEQLDLTDLYKERLASGKNRRALLYTPYALLRLFLDVLPEIPDKMVYLDIDTMCLGNIRELYDIDLTEKEYAASRDILGKVWYQKDYCNSGVLLLNMKKIRETGLFARAREMVYNKHMYMPDQSALNALATARTFLPERFNEQRAIKKDTLIKHFCKGIRWILFIPFTYNIKQWHRDKVHSRLKIHQFDDVYEQFDELAEKHDLNL